MIWEFKEKANSEISQNLQDTLKIDSVLAGLMVQRGLTTFDKAKAFFNPDLADLHDPFLMKDMDLAVARILKALEQGEKVMVFGDYDVDGTTSVALMSSYLETLDLEIVNYIPDRYKEGYGISNKGIETAAAQQISLIVALDCGIKSIDHIAYAKELGVDFIICDHHRPGAEIPDAVAVLDPKRKDCEYPYEELSGCGVGFKLIQALQQTLELDFDDLVTYLDLCAISIGADIVDVTGENRILAHHGMALLNREARPGIQALMDQNDKEQYSLTDVIFTIGPKINASGRMEHGLYAVELLLEQDPQIAKQKAEAIQNFNEERKEADQRISKEALEQIIAQNEQEASATVVYDESWHKGVIGIVASRLIDTYYRPTLVFTKSGDVLAASARSVKGFDVYKAIEACSELLEQFGGHMYAAGMTLKEENYPAFKKKFLSVVEAQHKEEDKIKEISIDQELPFKYIDDKFYRILRRMEPFGPGNELPVFCTRNLWETGYARLLGSDECHLKLNLQDLEEDKTYQAIGFGLGDSFDLVKDSSKVDVVYHLSQNNFRGNVNFQLMLQDIKATS
ncbi:MAG: single-stranded-DNA-specific exonuclease RecJ [Flavobacteriaceae bacterium]